MTDAAGASAETHREVRRRRIAAGEARTTLIRRRYAAPTGTVWDACTDPERLGRWFLPVTGEFRVGGTFALEGNAHGEILRCQAPHLLSLTWAYGDRPVDEVALRLSPDKDGGTVLELEHATVSGLVEWDGQMLDVLPDVGAGWEMGLFALGMYLRDGLPIVAAEFERTPAVQDLAERSGRAWAALVEETAPPEHPEATPAGERT